MSRLCDLLPPVFDLHWLFDRLQRHHFSHYTHSVHLVHLPYPVLHAEENPRSTLDLWSLSARSLGYPNQSCVLGLHLLHCYLDTVPHYLTCYRSEYELFRSYLACHYFRRTYRLVDYRTQALQTPRRTRGIGILSGKIT